MSVVPPAMLEVTTAGWAATLCALAVLFAWDLRRAAHRHEATGIREATAWSLFYVAVAAAFGIVLALLAGWGNAGQYFAGYLVEKSLSLDNLFVFLIIMSTFAVPARSQPWALTVGIIVALLLRGVFIAIGAALLAALSVMFAVFGVVLVITAIQLFRHRNIDPSVNDNVLVNAARRLLPVADAYDGQSLVTRTRGRLLVTPLFLVLLAIGSTDLLFALDSIPAVFGVTQHPYIVFAANAFALLGLRPLFFLTAGLLDRLIYLSAGLSVILAFVGVKLILHFVHLQAPTVPEISTGVSLIVIVVVLVLTTIASVLKARAEPTRRAHTGSLRAQHSEPPTDTCTRRTAGAAPAGAAPASEQL